MDIVIKETQFSDLTHIQSLWNDGDVMYYVGFPDGLGITVPELEKWLAHILEKRPHQKNHYSIYDNEGNYCGEAYYAIDAALSIAAVDIKLFCHARGKGIAKKALLHAINEAFNHGATEVYVTPNIDNTRAIKLYQTLGFQKQPAPLELFAEPLSEKYIYMTMTNEGMNCQF
ncbi:MAG: GNAT family N-acetyltransferase [Aerococcaceae bacterium]|nr:GNAT family N-acetyltransferase [Aerococcaceae bacterium]